jgi:hypothetical protein
MFDKDARDSQLVQRPASCAICLFGGRMLLVKSDQPKPSRKPYRAATREGMARIATTISPEVQKELKRLAIDLDLTLEALIREAIRGLLRQHGRPVDLLKEPPDRRRREERHER